MSIFGSDRPSGTMGGLLSGLFGGRNTAAASAADTTSPRSGGFGRKLATGALLAAGAAYLYNRRKNQGVSVTGFNTNE